MEEQYFALGDVHEAYPDEEYAEIEEELLAEDGFGSPDLILLHGGPNAEEEGQRYAAFDDIRQHLSPDDDTVLLHTDGYADRLDGSGIEVQREQLQPTSTVEEVNAIRGRVDPGDRVLTVTNDYHVPRTESLLDRALDDSIDYLVAGAEWHSDEAAYVDKWASELASTILPQRVKDLGKRLLR